MYTVYTDNRARALYREKQMRLELGIMAGAESKVWLADLTKQIDRLERLTGGKGLKAEVTSDEIEEEQDVPVDAETEEEDFAPKKAKPSKKAVAAFEEETEEAAEETEEEEADFAAPVKKAKKAAKVTLDDVNDACKARARAVGGKKGIEAVKAILLKKFKTDSITKIKEENYPAIVAAMAV